MSETYAIGNQTWKTPADGDIKNDTLEKWGSVDRCHKYLQSELQKEVERREAAEKALRFTEEATDHALHCRFPFDTCFCMDRNIYSIENINKTAREYFKQYEKDNTK